jgi:hypothetical protein
MSRVEGEPQMANFVADGRSQSKVGFYEIQALS